MSLWRLFPDQKSAQAYADACWTQLLKQAPAGQVPDKQPLAKYPADVDQALAQITALAPAQQDAVKGELAATPLRGVDHKGQVVASGQSTAWAMPMPTLDGQWAVPCPPFDAKGGPEPKWPAPVFP